MKFVQKSFKFSWGSYFTLSMLLLVSSYAQAQESHDIVVGYSTSKHYHIQSRIQHSGKVIVRRGENNQVRDLPLSVDAKLDFHERFIGTAKTPQVIRHYNNSQANIQIDKGVKASKLKKSNELVVARLRSNAVQALQSASVKDMLTQSELDLIKNPADPLTLGGFLNKDGVKVDEEWTPKNDDLAKFLSVDEIISSDVKLKLKEATDQTFKIYVMGRVEAKVEDVETEMNVSCVLIVDTRAKRVSSLSMNVVEKRDAGQIAPGFDGKTKITMQISNDSKNQNISKQALVEATKNRKIRQLLRWQSDSGAYAVQYDPSWKIISTEKESAVMRYLKDGDLLCQCNIVQLGRRPAGKPMTLNEFKAEIQKIIASTNTQQVTSSSQLTTNSGLKALQVSVIGEEKNIPFQWTYYNLTNTDGQQVTFVFTLERASITEVEPVAKKMINGLVFRSTGGSKANVSRQNSSSSRR